MYNENKIAYRIALIATFFALFVVMLGAYTRLKDAGLGCPDWPTCYGQIVVPNTPERLHIAIEKFPNQVIEQGKAWAEMAHRYAVGILGLLVLTMVLLVLRKCELPRQPNRLSLLLIALIIFQGLLGKWTVTMRLLPAVVMSHLLGGMALLSLLWLLAMRLGGYFENWRDINYTKIFKPWAILGLLILIGQIFLGGWTSSNYAAMACPDFPYCQGKLIPLMDFHSAFHFWMTVGPNYQGGTLDNVSRVTIHMMHRFGALVTFLYWLWLSVWIVTVSKINVLKQLAAAILFILVVQICLGILNVIWSLPLTVAVLHNGIAALLLLTVVTLNYALYATAQK